MCVAGGGDELFCVPFRPERTQAIAGSSSESAASAGRGVHGTRTLCLFAEQIGLRIADVCVHLHDVCFFRVPRAAPGCQNTQVTAKSGGGSYEQKVPVRTLFAR
jgi:hypothetical protein